MSPRLPPAGSDRERHSRPRGGGLPRFPQPGEAMREAFRAAGLKVEQHSTSAEGARTQSAAPRPSPNGTSHSSPRPQQSVESPSADGKPAPEIVGAKPQPLEPPTRDERLARLKRRLEGLAAASETDSRMSATASAVPSTAEIERLQARHRAGASTQDFDAGSRHGRAVEIVLGVDFGTTSTKIVARLPYEAGAPSFAVPALPFARAEGHAYLWASRLWLAPGGVFSLRPLPDAALACAIKTFLIAPGPSGRAVLDAGEGLAASAEEAATAFLALQIRQAKGWLATEKVALLRKGPPRWSFNLGFPAASLNDAVLRARYERCAAAALDLAAEPSEVTLPDVKLALADVAADAPRRLERQRAALHPEIAAVVAGFANSNRHEDGLYAFVDVGGGTVDCCTFNLFKAKDGGARCPIFSAQVELLGVERWRLCESDPTAADDFRFLLDTFQRTVILDTKRRRYPLSERWLTGLPLFFVGGGVSSHVHLESTTKLDPWLRRSTSKKVGVRLEPLPFPESLKHPECSADKMHRLGVAIGLSMPLVDIPEVNLPDEIEDAELIRRAPPDDNYVGKDQV